MLRVHRDGLDRWFSRLRPAHRYSCVDLNCGWTGRLEVAPGASRLSRRVGPLPLSTWLMIGAVLALGVVDGARRYLNAQEAAEYRRQAWLAATEPEPPGPVPGRPPGWHFAGEPVPVALTRTVAADPSKLTLLRNCVWGEPGRNPYRGTPQQALTAAGLPPEVVREISAMIASGLTPTRVEISNDGIRTLDGRREFSPTVPAMAFGRSLCLDTVVNFKTGHVEPAPLFEASDRNGRLYSVMVPSVCGNVSVVTERPLAGESVASDDGGQVLGERAEDGDAPQGTRVAGLNGDSPNSSTATTTGTGSARSGGGGTARTTGTSTTRRNVVVNEVPEPGTIAMVGLALAVMPFTMRRRFRRPDLKKSP